MKRLLTLVLFLMTWNGAVFSDYDQTIRIGSKRFTEAYVLAGIAKEQLQRAGFNVELKQGLGGTMIAWKALASGAVDICSEYTGTIEKEILKSSAHLGTKQMGKALKKYGVGMSKELGFNNTYALVMKESEAKHLGIRTVSDLKKHPLLRYGISPEYLNRKDGWGALSKAYQLSSRYVKGVDHAIGYSVLKSGQIDVMDAYSTDPKIAEYGLVELKDPLHFFPSYNAVYLYRLSMPQKAIDALNNLGGTLTEKQMIRLNQVAEKTQDDAYAASLYFKPEGVDKIALPSGSFKIKKIMIWTGQHLVLVGWSLLIAMIVGIPLGIIASHQGIWSQLIIGFAGMIQTVPSLALLALLVPVPGFGISVRTAIFALFLYSLLPIIRNTMTGILEIPISLRESAQVLGLEPFARLIKIYIPLASRMILSGIKTSAVINVGNATLAALIGAGGLGEPIISGLALNDPSIIFQGAIPAAALALLVQLLFNGLDLFFIPKGLRLKQPSIALSE